MALVASSCTRPDEASSDSTSVSIAPATGASGSDDEHSDDSGAGEPADDMLAATTSPAVTTSTRVASSTSVDAGSAAEQTGEPTASTTVTTAASTTTSSTVPTPPDDASDLTLIFDGILPFRFGDRDVDVVPALTELLRAPTHDVLREYPEADQGIFLDATGEESFVARFGRTVCYANSLCVQFGAGAPETLIFTGWRVGDTASGLTTEDGLTVGSTLDEFADVITFDPALGCFQVVDGSAVGIDVTLLSDDGDFATSTPDPAAVTVIEMRAGQLPVSLLADC